MNNENDDKLLNSLKTHPELDGLAVRLNDLKGENQRLTDLNRNQGDQITALKSTKADADNRVAELEKTNANLQAELEKAKTNASQKDSQ